MFLDKLIALMQNNLDFIISQKARFEATGDVDMVVQYDKEISDTQLIISKLTKTGA